MSPFCPNVRVKRSESPGVFDYCSVEFLPGLEMKSVPAIAAQIRSNVGLRIIERILIRFLAKSSLCLAHQIDHMPIATVRHFGGKYHISKKLAMEIFPITIAFRSMLPIVSSLARSRHRPNKPSRSVGFSPALLVPW